MKPSPARENVIITPALFIFIKRAKCQGNCLHSEANAPAEFLHRCSVSAECVCRIELLVASRFPQTKSLLSVVCQHVHMCVLRCRTAVEGPDHQRTCSTLLQEWDLTEAGPKGWGVCDGARRASRGSNMELRNGMSRDHERGKKNVRGGEQQV